MLAPPLATLAVMSGIIYLAAVRLQEEGEEAGEEAEEEDTQIE